jgi:hypothetical protein
VDWVSLAHDSTQWRLWKVAAAACYCNALYARTTVSASWCAGGGRIEANKPETFSVASDVNGILYMAVALAFREITRGHTSQRNFFLTEQFTF